MMFEDTTNTKKQYYRTVIEIELLSEEPLRDMDLEQINYEMTEGHCSGQLRTTIDNEPVDGPTMANLLLTQGSDAEFFGLTENGQEMEL